MKIVWRYSKPYIGPILLCLILLLAQALCSLLLPSMMSEMVDMGIVAMDGQPGQWDFIMRIGVNMVALSLAGMAVSVLVGYVVSKLSSSISARMRRDVFAKVEGFSIAEFDRFSTASLITRTTNDVQNVQMLINMGIRMLGNAVVMGVGGVVLALGTSTSMSWIIALAVIILLCAIGVVSAMAMPRFTLLQKLVDKLNLVSRENLSGMMVIRAFGNEEREVERFTGANADLRDTNLFVQRLMSSMMPAMSIIMNLTSLAIIWVGGRQIVQSGMQLGSMMAFVQYAMMIIMSFLMMSMMFIMLPRAMASAKRIGEVLDTESVVNDPQNPTIIAHPVGDIAFEHVSFRYGGAEADVLHDISFIAKHGQTTAFIGPTGSGKSTVVNLIPRFYDVTAGRITIDGVDIRDMTQRDLRAMIGYVPQHGVLFSGTIASNIREGAHDASDADIAEAIRSAQAEEFVSAREGGANADVSQGGSNVSGGQKQRLSIARALVRKPPIFIFDDSFSALDYRTDAALRRALKEGTKDSAVLIVAQRVSTIMNADNIVVLDNGAVAGMGTHRELLASCGAYREIAESQLSKEELA